MEELLENVEEFLDSGNENFVKKRFNAAASDFFKAVVILCDYLIYREIKIMPKSHNERFTPLKGYFPEIYKKVSKLFKTYTKSYNLRLSEEESLVIKNYAYELKTFVLNKK